MIDRDERVNGRFVTNTNIMDIEEDWQQHGQ